jgi:hypothetical protein
MKTILFIFLAASAASAQVASATLVGTVTDPSSAVVPGAVITVTNEATGFSRSTVSDGLGNYTFGQISPGVYRVAASKSGFAQFQADRVTLELNQRARM